MATLGGEGNPARNPHSDAGGGAGAPIDAGAVHWLTFETDLPDARFTVRRARMREELGRLFELEVELVADEPTMRLDLLLGRQVAVRLIRPDGEVKLVTGFVARIALARGAPGVGEYRATVVPFLWFLTRQKSSRIFQGRTVRQIVAEVLGKYYRYDALDWKLAEKYETHEYRVQYQESDYAFLSRLMEQEGIYFWVEHTDGAHRVCFADSPGPHACEPGYEQLPYRPAGSDSLGKWIERITELELTRELLPTRYSHTDYDFKKPETPLYSAQTSARVHHGAGLEVFEFPGEMVEVKESERLSRVRLEEISAGHLVMRGITDAPGLGVARTFRVSEHASPDVSDREWLTTAVEWEASNNLPYSLAAGGSAEGNGADEPRYVCRFRAIPADVPYRTPRTTPRPLIAGIQSAVVTGPEPIARSAREEIWTDEYGRVKVHFHWDRHGETDENSSCWIRVSQLWAGQNFGAMFIPRVGHEVLVEFLEGDPDQPLITGRVYNRRNMPPHPLPGSKNTSTIMSRSTKEGGRENFNEIRMVDTKGEELLYVQAEKDRTVLVKHDNSESVGNDEGVSVGHDRTKTVGHDEKIRVENDRTEFVGNNQVTTIKSNAVEVVGANKKVSVAQSILVEAGTSITLRCGASMIHMNQAGVILIQGTIVQMVGAINCGVSAPVTMISGALLMNLGVLTVSEGAVVNKVMGGVTTVDGKPVKINAI